MNGEVGTIYLIHFERPYHHAKHYIGWSSDVDARMIAHEVGRGSALMRAVTGAGIKWKVVRTWPGTRDDERRLHRQKNSPARLCPVCLEAAKAVKAG